MDRTNKGGQNRNEDGLKTTRRMYLHTSKIHTAQGDTPVDKLQTRLRLLHQPG